MTSRHGQKARMDQESTSATKNDTENKACQEQANSKTKDSHSSVFLTFINPISIFLTDSKRALKAGKMAHRVEGTSHQA